MKTKENETHHNNAFLKRGFLPFVDLELAEEVRRDLGRASYLKTYIPQIGAATIAIDRVGTVWLAPKHVDVPDPDRFRDRSRHEPNPELFH